MRHCYTILFIFASLFLLESAVAQVTLGDVPGWTANNRFYSDVVVEVKRPSLSLNGFDCGNDCDKGLGLKQVLEAAYSNDNNESITEVYSEVKDLEAEVPYDPTPSTRDDIARNTQVIQARAFIALTTYVLERNGENPSSLDADLPSHDIAMQRLRSALTSGGWYASHPKLLSNDGVKWTATVANMARALDLYLAIENAYCHYGAQGHLSSQQECNGTSSNYLLSSAQKADVFADFEVWIENLEASKGWSVPGNWATGVDRFDFEPGNWPLKVQTAMGYAVLAAQDVNGVCASCLRAYLRRAMSANFRSAGNDRYRYFNYQTDDGKRFWAEGAYYFHYALGDVLPFWHAIRINSMLDYHPSFNAPDPFKTNRFTKPLEWLADIVTPDGMTPPLDDGNKHNMRYSTILRWRGAYGDVDVGNKFAWIADRYLFGSEKNMLPVEIAIPRQEIGQGVAPIARLGNLSASQSGEQGEQQAIIRRSANANACEDENISGCHYVLLNGESGDSYERGEGHEQPDQLQLLYYVDGTSYLLDSGYDKGAVWGNSTWNDYLNHNVLMGVGGNGGLPSPSLDSGIRKDINVYSVDYVTRSRHGEVDVINGKQYLPHAIVEYDGRQSPATTWRKVLFIGGSSPYLIDFHRATHNTPINNIQHSESQFKVSYHVNSFSLNLNNFETDAGRFLSWSNVDGSNGDLYMYPVTIQYYTSAPLGDISSNNDDGREEFGSGNQLAFKRLDINNVRTLDHDEFTVATVIQARSSAPYYAPALIWSPGRTYQGWVWKKSANVYDVFVAHAARANKTSLSFNVDDANSGYPDFRLHLPSGVAYGFARIRYENGGWKVDPNYQINLDRGAPTVSISGPTQLDSGEQGTWTANVSSGTGSQTYRWYDKYPADEDFIDTGVTTQTFTNAYYGNVELKVEVTDNGHVVSDVHAVSVDCVQFCVESVDEEIALAEAGKITSHRVGPVAGVNQPELLPEAFALEGNFPNPFTGQTTIRYALPEAAPVELTVYDVRGREVVRLVDDRKRAGYHEARFEAGRLPSGVYFYRLRAGEAFAETRRMVLVR